VWQLLPLLVQDADALNDVRRVGAQIGLIQLQSDASDWTVYASYVAIGLLHASASGVG